MEDKALADCAVQFEDDLADAHSYRCADMPLFYAMAVRDIRLCRGLLPSEIWKLGIRFDSPPRFYPFDRRKLFRAVIRPPYMWDAAAGDGSAVGLSYRTVNLLTEIFGVYLKRRAVALFANLIRQGLPDSAVADGLRGGMEKVISDTEAHEWRSAVIWLYQCGIAEEDVNDLWFSVRETAGLYVEQLVDDHWRESFDLHKLLNGLGLFDGKELTEDRETASTTAGPDENLSAVRKARDTGSGIRRLQRLRKRCGLTQEDVVTGVGYSLRAVRRHEREVRSLRPDHLACYAEFFGKKLNVAPNAIRQYLKDGTTYE